MSDILEFKIDKKQDNRRLPIDFKLIKLSYILNTSDILREIKYYKSYSGYCLDPIDDNDFSVSFDEIGKVLKWTEHPSGKITYEIYSYLHNKSNSREKLLNEITIYKNDLIKKLNLIPTS